MDYWGITDSGKVRKHNQDVFRTLTNEKQDIVALVVCDGMGGANAGNVASELAAGSFIDYMNTKIDDLNNAKNQNDLAVVLTSAVLEANAQVHKKSLQDEDLTGMGTTLTAAISSGFGEVVANIGDSRLYHVTNNKITQITRDHSVVEDMVEKGEITRNEARRHPSRNLLTRVLGTGFYEPPDIFFLSINSDDSIILCSDGLTNVVTDNEIQFEVSRGATVRDSCEALVKMALERGAPDNVTVVILKR